MPSWQSTLCAGPARASLRLGVSADFVHATAPRPGGQHYGPVCLLTANHERSSGNAPSRLGVFSNSALACQPACPQVADYPPASSSPPRRSCRPVVATFCDILTSSLRPTLPSLSSFLFCRFRSRFVLHWQYPGAPFSSLPLTVDASAKRVVLTRLPCPLHLEKCLPCPGLHESVLMRSKVPLHRIIRDTAEVRFPSSSYSALALSLALSRLVRSVDDCDALPHFPPVLHPRASPLERRLARAG